MPEAADPFDLGPPPSSWPEGNAPVYDRDGGGRCVIPRMVPSGGSGWSPCPSVATSVHHRIHGDHSSRRPSGLLSVCGDGTTGHHGYIEANPAEAMLFRWTLSRFGTDPAEEQVWLWHPIWGLGWFRLDDNYGVTPAAPPGEMGRPRPRTR
jgi:hypothetical protein